MEYNEKVIELIKEHCQGHLSAYEARPFGQYPICYKVMGKLFVQFNTEENFYKITLKCTPDKAYLYRELYPGIIVRGYHCPPVQQPYWNTIDLDAFSDMELLFQMIDEAYDAVTEKMAKKAKMHLSSLSEFQFIETDGENPDFVMLCDKLDDTLSNSVGGKLQRSLYNRYNQRDSIHDVIIAYQNGKPIACGAFKLYDEEHAELQRIYTEPSFRGMGLGAEIVRRLEAKAKIKGYRWCLLETGKTFEEACMLYKKAGYKVIPNYGQYVDMANSICMEKKI